MAFIIDTDALVHISNRSDGDAIYQQLIPHCQSGNILTVTQVFGELKRFEEVRSLFWPIRNFMMVDQDHIDVMTFVGYLADSFEFLYDLSGAKNRDPADPWLIACAKVHNHVLITDERQASTKKIPYICRQQNVDVECYDGPEMLRLLGI